MNEVNEWAERGKEKRRSGKWREREKEKKCFGVNCRFDMICSVLKVFCFEIRQCQQGRKLCAQQQSDNRYIFWKNVGNVIYCNG